MKNKFVLFVLVALLSCSPDNDSYENSLSGYYRVVSIQSDVSVDLNNDGVQSDDIFDEIAGPHHGIDGSQLSFWDFNSPDKYAEVRPLKNTMNSAKLIAFNLPGQYIDYLANGTPFLVEYLHSSLNYSYEFIKGSNFIELTKNNPDETGDLNSLELLESDQLKLELTKPTFDFVSQEWIELNMTVVFQKN